MFKFHPAGVEQKTLKTTLGSMVYYTMASEPPGNVDRRPPLIFLHNVGGGAAAYEWSKVYPAFAPTHHVLAPDLIGWGQSAHPTQDYTIEDYLTTITDFIQTVAQSPALVVASSWTGALMMRLATQRPELFQALFLVCPSGFMDFGTESGRRLPLPLVSLPFVDSLIYTLGAMNEVAVRNFLERFLYTRSSRLAPEVVAAYLASAQQPNAEYAALAFLKGNLYFDVAPYVQRLQVPTTFFWGEQAQFTSIELGRRLAALNPAIIRGFEPIPDTGILPHLEQPAVFIGKLLRYIGGLT
jgi:pimeloyl-ACP methyl ester carboxylesterase